MEQGAPSDPTLRREGPPSEPTTENVLMPEPQPAERLGRFLVIEAIGQGGMGVVYRGYDPALDRRVALKVLRAEEAATGEALAPGAVVAIDGEALVVACGGGTRLRLLDVQPESRRPMTGRAFAAGARLQPGASLA